MTEPRPINMTHARTGLPAEIYQRPDGYWILPGGKTYCRWADAQAAAQRMFRAAGYRAQRKFGNNPHYGS